ncbi:hypothetical protein NicSoilC12_10380 [Arthrobacter sp. NicSoilC12]|nr:hypothetical protein NicSoilC12_10380 [Arthrobacter sp. NicSoilC12]
MRTIGRNAAMLTTRAMIMPITEALARLAAAAAMTGFTGGCPDGSGPAAGELPAGEPGAAGEASCNSLTPL